PKTSIICSPMTSLKTSIKTITYLSDTGCLEIQGASLIRVTNITDTNQINILSICNKVLIIQFIAGQPNSQNNNQELLIKIKNIFSEYEIIAISITTMSWSLFHSLLVNIATTFVKHSCPASGILCTLIPQTSGRP
ncbi:hypothetical protein PJ239_24780, partial [Escherichia coli]